MSSRAKWSHFPGGNARASLKPCRGLQQFGWVSHFPGGNARASLKHAGPTTRRGWRRTHFPGGNARASLKLQAKRHPKAEVHHPLPRRKRPGLIEAPPIRLRSRRTDCHFPGGNARASLKHNLSGVAVNRMRGHFPGGNARASLKHAPVRTDASRRSGTSQAETPGPH